MIFIREKKMPPVTRKRARLEAAARAICDDFDASALGPLSNELLFAVMALLPCHAKVRLARTCKHLLAVYRENERFFPDNRIIGPGHALVREIPLGENVELWVAFGISRNGNVLVNAIENGMVCILEIARDGKRIRCIPVPSPMTKFFFLGDKCIASNNINLTMTLFSLDGGSVAWTRHTTTCVYRAFLLGGDRFIVMYVHTPLVSIHSLSTGEKIHEFECERAPARATFDHVNNRILVGMWERPDVGMAVYDVGVYDATTFALVGRICDGGSGIAVDDIGQIVVTGTGDGNIAIYAPDLSLIRTIPCEKRVYHQCEIDRDGMLWVACGWFPKTICVFNTHLSFYFSHRAIPALTISLSSVICWMRCCAKARSFLYTNAATLFHGSRRPGRNSPWRTAS